MSDSRGPATTTRWTPPTILRPGFRCLERAIDGATWQHERAPLSIIATVSTERDGREWVHVSVAHRTRMPTWDELREIKEWVLGDAEAYSVLPPKARYVNTHPFCLHLFACLDGPQLPDFRVDGVNL